MLNNIYIIGHKSPDLDSVAGAIAYAEFKNIVEKTDKYQPAITGKVNIETKYVLDLFRIKTPEILINASEKNIILVDHNEKTQAVEGIESANILEVLDHHKVNFNFGVPILFRSIPLGASCTIIAIEFFNKNIEINKELAGLMLSAILIDTVITKSPTCTDSDVEIIEKLSSIAKIENWREFGVELFKIRSNVKSLSLEEIIKSDFKEFNTGSGKVGIGQIETVDLSEFDSMNDDLLLKLEEIKNVEGYHTIFLFITDILKEGSLFLISTNDKNKMQKAFNAEFIDNKEYIDGIISRKKQVAPKVEQNFN